MISRLYLESLIKDVEKCNFKSKNDCKVEGLNNCPTWKELKDLLINKEYNFIEDEIKTNNFYLTLKRLEYSEEIENLIKELEDKYIATFYKTNVADFLNLEDEANYERHSEQSEIFSKIILLVHQFKGYKGVTEIVNKINWRIQDVVQENYSELEKRLGKIKEK